jgi:Uma2 family endonuclease
MSVQTQYVFRADPMYPDDDGLPMADNTLQYRWIVYIEQAMEHLFRDRPDVFVAGNLLWYPVEGSPKVRAAPDALVAFGRPKGYRGSYKQWDEEDVPPQVVFEVLSPGNRPGAMNKKFRFYERHGVEEYYIFDPDRGKLAGWIREGDRLVPIESMSGWVSPLLQTRFELSGRDLVLYGPDGGRLLAYAEVQRDAEEQRERAEAERERAEELHQKAERLAARLRELGIDPEA